MKKLALFTIITVLSLAGISQNLAITYEGEPIPNGGAIMLPGDITIPELVAELDVTNTSANTIDVKVTKVENYLIPGSANYFCWGACYPPNVYTSPLFISIGPGQTNTTDFSGHYSAGGIFGVSSVSFMFFDMNHPADQVTVEILFNAGTVGITETKPLAPVLNCHPNPANEYSWIKFNVYSDLSAPELKVVNLAGSVMHSELLESHNGSVQLSTALLPNGIYFVSILSEGRTVISKKIIVNH